MEYRVEQLAAACDVSVDTVRYYQTRGLLAPPRREGRVAVYDDEHAERLRRIRALQRKGLPLSVIGRVLEGRIDRADEDLAAAVAAAQLEREDEELLTVDEFAQRSGVPAPLVRALERAGVSVGRAVDGATRYTTDDVEVLQVGFRLLEAGLPLTELLAIAQQTDALMRTIAERAVDLFDGHIRRPIRASAPTEEEAAERVVTAFGELLPAVTALVAHHFRRVLLEVAQEHMERVGDDVELAATKAEARRRVEVAWGG